MSRQRVSQPPVNPLLRDAERHDFWPAFVVALVAGVLLFCGVRHVTGLETQEGDSAWEVQLVKAFARGGLQFQEAAPPLNPAAYQDPGRAAEAMDRAARLADLPLRARYRVNTGAADPCPT